MPFRLRKDVRPWFKQISHVFPIDFDMYYFCLMAGLAGVRKEDVPHSDATDLIDSFPERGGYRTRGRLIVALFLSRELKHLGIRLTERGPLHKAIRQYIDPGSAAYLSELGFKEINKYAHGGFDVLGEWFPEAPQLIEVFLPRYREKLAAALNVSASMPPPSGQST